MPGRLQLPGQWTDQTEVAEEDAMLAAQHQSSHTRVVMRAVTDDTYERVIKPHNSDDQTTERFTADEQIHALWKTIEWLRERERTSVKTRGGR